MIPPTKRDFFGISSSVDLSRANPFSLFMELVLQCVLHLKTHLNFSNQSCRSCLILPMPRDLLSSLRLKCTTIASHNQQDSFSERKFRSDFASCFLSAATHCNTCCKFIKVLIGIYLEVLLPDHTLDLTPWWGNFSKSASVICEDSLSQKKT